MIKLSNEVKNIPGTKETHQVSDKYSFVITAGHIGSIAVERKSHKTGRIVVHALVSRERNGDVEAIVNELAQDWAGTVQKYNLYSDLSAYR